MLDNKNCYIEASPAMIFRNLNILTGCFAIALAAFSYAQSATTKKYSGVVEWKRNVPLPDRAREWINGMQSEVSEAATYSGIFGPTEKMKRVNAECIIVDSNSTVNINNNLFITAFGDNKGLVNAPFDARGDGTRAFSRWPLHFYKAENILYKAKDKEDVILKLKLFAGAFGHRLISYSMHESFVPASDSNLNKSHKFLDSFGDIGEMRDFLPELLIPSGVDYDQLSMNYLINNGNNVNINIRAIVTISSLTGKIVASTFEPLIGQYNILLLNTSHRSALLEKCGEK